MAAAVARGRTAGDDAAGLVGTARATWHAAHVTSTYDRADVAARIDATAIGPETTAADVRHLCAAALMHRVRGVCVRTDLLPTAVAEVAGSGLEIVGTAGFPDGAGPTETKVSEIEAAATAGAHEVDVVMHHRALRAGDEAEARADLDAVVRAAHDADLQVKVILETGALDSDLPEGGTGAPEGGLVEHACRLAVDAGADWVKTSTGSGPRGATPDDVRRLRAAVADRARIKAAGGIRAWDQAVALLDAGADAIGCSRFVALLEGAPRGRDGRASGRWG